MMNDVEKRLLFLTKAMAQVLKNQYYIMGGISAVGSYDTESKSEANDFLASEASNSRLILEDLKSFMKNDKI